MKLTRLLLPAIIAFSATAMSVTYTVRNGDSLSSVARATNTDIQQLMRMNNLSSSTIQVGQRLEVNGSTTDTTSSRTAANNGAGSAYIRSATSRFLGIRYVLGGNSFRGIDCSSFTMNVFRQLGINLPRTAAEQWRVGMSVSRRNLQAGDLVFFNTMGRTASHVGIYMGNGMMANANSFYGHTMIEPLFASTYWSSRYDGARRILN